MAAATKEPEEAEEGAPAKPKRSWRRLLLFCLVGLLTLGGGGGAAYYFFFHAKAETKIAAAAPKPPTFLDLPEMLVNLSNIGSDKVQYLKVKVVLELPEPLVVQQITPVLPRVMDTFQVFLREMRPSDLEGSAGIYRLREELTRRVNVAVAPTRVNAVLFKEIVVQ